MRNDQALKVLGGDVPLRFVQIATGNSGNAEDIDHTVYGLTADGQVYQYMRGVEYLKEPRTAINLQGKPYTTNYGPYFYWWQPLRMSDEKGPEFEQPATPKEFL